MRLILAPSFQQPPSEHGEASRASPSDWWNDGDAFLCQTFLQIASR